MARSLWHREATWTVLLFVAARAAAWNVRLLDVRHEPSPVLPVPEVEITPAPSIEALDLGLRGIVAPRAGLSCATACVNNIVTRSTDCTLSDLVCECKSINEEIIYAGALSCAINACGYLVAESYFSAAASVCSSVQAGDYTGLTTTTDASATAATATGNAAGVTTVVTKTATSGSSTIYSYVTTTDTSSSSTTTSSNSSGGSDSSSGGGISKGAIAGIAVGGTVGAIAVIALVALLLWKCCFKKNPGAVTNTAVVPPPQAAQTQPLLASPPPVDPMSQPQGFAMGKAELGGQSEMKAYAVVPSAGTPVSANPSSVSRHASAISTPSPGPPISPISSSATLNPSPTTYPLVSELNAQPWQQHAPAVQQGYMTGPQPGYPQQAYAHPGQSIPGVHYQEVEGARPEVMGDTHIRQELHGQPHNGGLYEMPGGPAAPH